MICFIIYPPCTNLLRSLVILIHTFKPNASQSTDSTCLINIMKFNLFVVVESFQAKVRCNDQASIYIDGEFRHNTTSDREVWTGDLPWNASLIAVSCLNTGYYGGLTAAFSNGLIMGDDWQCANMVDNDWYMPTYNDRLWKNAIPSNLQTTLLNFPFYAKWMWSEDGRYTTGGTTQCRGKIGIPIMPRNTCYCELVTLIVLIIVGIAYRVSSASEVRCKRV